MATKIYVGNLPFATTSEQLEDFFSQIGDVRSADVVFDLSTGRSRGFGFVLMESQDSAKSAIEKLNGTDLGGRNIVVNEAKVRAGGPKRFENSQGYGSSSYSGGGYGAIYGADSRR